MVLMSTQVLLKEPSIPVRWVIDEMPMQPVKRARDFPICRQMVLGLLNPKRLIIVLYRVIQVLPRCQLVTFKFQQVFILRIQKREVEIQKRWMQAGEINLSPSP